MKLKILGSLAATMLLVSSLHADVTYDTNGGFVKGTEVGTNSAFQNNFNTVGSEKTLTDGSKVYHEVRWGSPAGSTGKSGLSSGTASGTVALDTWVHFGNLIHFNFPISSSGGSLEYIQVRRELHLSDGNSVNDYDNVFSFDVYNWETSNGANPCPSNMANPLYDFPVPVVLPDGRGTVHSHVFTKSPTTLQGKCWDAHDFAATPDQDFKWRTSDNVYNIEIKGFYNSQGNLVHTFWAPEDGTSAGYAAFRIKLLDSSEANVNGRLWVDLNHDGIQNDASHNTATVPVKLYDEDNTLIASTTTDTNGYYVFTSVKTSANSEKDYYVKFNLPVSGFEFTSKDAGGDDAIDSDVDNTGKTDNFTLTGDNATMDAGIIFAALGDFVWDDVNENGIQDTGEVGIGGITVNLYKDGSTSPILSTQTGPDGSYNFEPLNHGEYVIEVEKPSNYIFSPQAQGSDDTKDSDVDSTGKTAPITLNFPNDAEHYEKYDSGMHVDWANVSGITITKRTNGINIDTAPEPVIYIVNGQSEVVYWTYVVQNVEENTNLKNISVTDDQGVVVTCPQDTLTSGESMTCTASALAVPGQYKNTGKVTATAVYDDAHEKPVEDSDNSSYSGIAVIASLSIEKTTNGTDADTINNQPHLDVGETVTWGYTVTNTGDSNLSSITVVDNKEGAVTCPNNILEPGDSMTCTDKTGTAIVGQYQNTATASALVYGYSIVSEDLSHYHGHALPVPYPSIIINKATNGNSGNSIDDQAYLLVGDPVTWSYVIENNGDTKLDNIIVVDDKEGTVTCPKTTLASHEEMSCEMSGTAIKGQYTNTSTVTAVYGDEESLEASDISRYFAQEPAPAPTPQGTPELQFYKTTNGVDDAIIEVGETVTWSYLVINIGDTLLYNIKVTDDKEGDIRCPSTTLPYTPPSNRMICTKEGVAILGLYENTGTVKAQYGDNQDLDPISDPSSYTGIDSGTAPEEGENCPCNDIKSDSSSTFGTVSAILMMLMTLMAGLFFVRREELLNRNER